MNSENKSNESDIKNHTFWRDNQYYWSWSR